MRQKRSSGVGTEPADRAPAHLAAASALLVEHGVCGLAWFDRGFTVTSRYGGLADFIAVGEPVGESVLPLIGLDGDMAALMSGAGAMLDIPAVSIILGQTQTPRLNLTVVWSPEQETYVLYVTRSSPRADLEVELTRQIRGRLIAEAEVTRKSLELARANRDLEEFASVIAHDLKAPMRAFRYLADELEGELEPASKKVRDRLAQLKDQSRRMSDMLTALLQYASLGHKRDALEPVDTQALLGAVVASMPRPPGLRIEVCGHWPVLETLKAPLDLVLRNLIDNAVTHHDREHGLVRVGGADRGNALEITVCDDGPGIAPEHREAVLLPFRKLRDDAGGPGMGLAVVSRTLDVIGGRLVMQPDAGGSRGTTIQVLWPKTIAL